VIRDSELLEYLASLKTEPFSGNVYRATRQGLDPTSPTLSSGRWMPSDSMAVLYTSLAKEGAMAELSFHLSLQTPLPSKPMTFHELRIETKKTVRITRKDFAKLGIDETQFGDIGYQRTSQVGDVAGFIGYDGILVPSARWDCENLIVLCDNHDINLKIDLLSSVTFDWQEWARRHGFIS
jgi:RES domain-containing protein